MCASRCDAVPKLYDADVGGEALHEDREVVRWEGVVFKPAIRMSACYPYTDSRGYINLLLDHAQRVIALQASDKRSDANVVKHIVLQAARNVNGIAHSSRVAGIQDMKIKAHTGNSGHQHNHILWRCQVGAHHRGFKKHPQTYFSTTRPVLVKRLSASAMSPTEVMALVDRLRVTTT